MAEKNPYFFFHLVKTIGYSLSKQSGTAAHSLKSIYLTNRHV